MIRLFHAIQSLRPGAEWSLNGEQYQQLEWNDLNQPKPTAEELAVEMARLQTQYENNDYQRKREREYPPASDYLDAVVKGDQEQMQAYIDACLAIKAKYPKPEEV